MITAYFLCQSDLKWLQHPLQETYLGKIWAVQLVVLLPAIAFARRSARKAALRMCLLFDYPMLRNKSVVTLEAKGS